MFGSTARGGSFTKLGTSQNQSLDGRVAGFPARSAIGPVIVPTRVVGSGSVLGSPIPLLAVLFCASSVTSVGTTEPPRDKVNVASAHRETTIGGDTATVIRAR